MQTVVWSLTSPADRHWLQICAERDPGVLKMTASAMMGFLRLSGNPARRDSEISVFAKQCVNSSSDWLMAGSTDSRLSVSIYIRYFRTQVNESSDEESSCSDRNAGNVGTYRNIRLYD
ncbi:hypothetical protein BaRGS_00009911 [Batillaria attramentaria]|uniref:Uncharacterized protein n=1 Tax=Batillaria attramentaria TaxID=370345 RepID=A0ABD0LIK9_9CAEN